MTDMKEKVATPPSSSSASASSSSSSPPSSSCSALKTIYNDCFNKWYAEKFLKGQWEKEECVIEWEAYRACVMKRMEDRKLHHLFNIDTDMQEG